MSLERERRRVIFYCVDNSTVKGFIEVIKDTKIADLINEPAQHYIIVYDAEIYYFEGVQSFKLISKLVEKKNMIVLNKSAIKWVEEEPTGS